MVAQVYETNRYPFLETTHPDYTPTSYEFFLGEFSPYTKLYDPNNEFTSLGGSKENPLIYTYKNTGITEFTINIISPTWINQSEVYPSYAFYELFIDGDKPYYFWSGPDNYKLYNLVCPIKATIGQTTKFKMRVTITSQSSSLLKYYFEGDPDIVYSSITAKFIADLPEETSEPIMITQDAPLQMNRRHIVKAPLLKILNSTMDENCKLGDWVEIKNMDQGNFQINSGDKIDILMNGLITRAKNGYIRSKKRGDFIRLECMETTPRIIFSDTNTIGSFTII